MPALLSPSVPSYFAVRYQAAPPLLRGRVLRPISGPEFTEAGEFLLDLARRHGCRYWLLDARADQARRPADVQDWMLEDFLPRAKAALGAAPCIAFVATDAFWQDRYIQGYTPLGAAPVTSSALTGGFTAVAKAVQWLNELRAGHLREKS